MNKIGILIIALFPCSLCYGAAPTISSVSNSGSVYTVTGTNYETPFVGDLASEYFDNETSETEYATDAQAIGTFETELLGADEDNCLGGGTWEQLAHLGWVIATKKAAANYSTGHGYRRATGALEPGQAPSSGDNAGITKTFAGQSGTVWVSWAMRYNSSGQDSNVSYPSEATRAGYADTLEKVIRVWDQTYTSPKMFTLNNKKVVWSQGSTCGTHIYPSLIFENNGTIDFPKYDSTITTAASCAEYISDSSIDKWMWFKLMLDPNEDAEVSDGEVKLYLDKGAGTVYLHNAAFIDMSDTGQTIALDIVKFGGNHSDTQQYFLTSDSSENVTVDFDDLVISTTEPDAPACVYLSNESTWGAGVTDRWNGDVNFVRQQVGGSAEADYGYDSWTNIEIKFVLNYGVLDTSSVYLYITNWSGETNATGFLISGYGDTETRRAIGVTNGAVGTYAATGATVGE